MKVMVEWRKWGKYSIVFNIVGHIYVTVVSIHAKLRIRTVVTYLPQ